MKKIILIAAIVALCGCSSLDFFGLEDNAPLHMVDKPASYPSNMFGSQMVATTNISNGHTKDILAVSAGTQSPTLLYQLSDNGNLIDVEDPIDQYLADKKEADALAWKSGTSLAKLQTWYWRSKDTLYTGCIALGETNFEDQGRVRIWCPDVFDTKDNILPFNSEKDFGREMASIAPINAQNWMLAIAARFSFAVFSQSGNGQSEVVHPTFNDEVTGEIIEIAAGRILSQNIYYVAVATSNKSDKIDATRVYLFVQNAPNSTELTQVTILERTGEPRFGAIMTTGDLNADGDDELIISAGGSKDRADAVYIWSVNSTGATEDPNAIITPKDGPLDIACEQGNRCDFGTSIAVGDIATDDSEGKIYYPELIIGAPGAKVDGLPNAGAVYIYRGKDILTNGEADVAGQVSDSLPEKNHNFGGQVTVAPIAGRNELIIGATGKGRFYIAFCTGVGDNIEDGADVTINSDAKVVSTRCRL